MARSGRRVEIAMLTAGLASFGLLYATQALLPSIGSAFDVGAASASLTVSAATIAVALCLVPAAALGARAGRPAVMRVGLLVACVLTGLAALAPTFGWLLAARAASGVAVTAVIALAMAHLGEQVPAHRIGSATGLYVAGTTLGGVLGRIVPAVVREFGSWRWAVGAVGLVGCALAVGFVFALPPERRLSPSTPPEPETGTLPGLRRSLADPGIAGLAVIAALLMGGFVATYNYLTYRLEAAPFRLSPAAVGFVFLAYLGGTISSAAAGRWSDRVGPKPVLLASIALSAAGLALTVPDNLAAVLAGLLLLTVGFFGAHATASGWVTRRVPALRGSASALYLTGYYLGSSVGGWAIGFAWSSGQWPRTALTVGALDVAAFGVALTLRYRRAR